MKKIIYNSRTQRYVEVEVSKEDEPYATRNRTAKATCKQSVDEILAAREYLKKRKASKRDKKYMKPKSKVITGANCNRRRRTYNKSEQRFYNY